MNNNLKFALRQGVIIFLAMSLGGILIAQPANLIEVTPGLFLLALFMGTVRTIAVYLHKKNVIEDERLIGTRQKAQSAWFIVFLAAIPGIPELVIIYTNYIQNPLIPFGENTIPLDEMAWLFLVPACALSFTGLIGSAITEKILMKSHEK